LRCLQGKDWVQAVIPLGEQKDFKIKFSATVGKTTVGKSDIAIDDISFDGCVVGKSNNICKIIKTEERDPHNQFPH